ncbi:response regulator transcription factor [Rhodococcus opacus]|uniref:response regulator transcription factor n=1 Tax=Rhodococcus opacus TaxID=37919 RepID=UPI001F546437|nr:helix-turn-helix transcriptional regulator [Rhodococcus opacus]
MYDEQVRHGKAMTFENAVTYALDEEQGSASPPGVDSASGLTRRERQVAGLVAEGLTNKAIAAQLVISQRTAQGHVEHILAKLGFTSRAQIAVWVVGLAEAERRGSASRTV